MNRGGLIQRIKNLWCRKDNEVNISKVANFLNIFYMYNAVPNQKFEKSEAAIMSKDIISNPSKYEKEIELIDNYLSPDKLVFEMAVCKSAITFMSQLVKEYKLNKRTSKLSKIK